jgi:hypothetical protein
MIVDASWYVLNTVIRRDLQTATVKDEIRPYLSEYSASLTVHRNYLLVNLMAQPDSNRLLRRHCQMICLPDSKCSTFSYGCSLLSTLLNATAQVYTVCIMY